MTDDQHFIPDPELQPSGTAAVLQELALYGYRPFDDEPDARPLPDGRMAAGAVADIFDAMVATLQDTRIEPDLEDLLWGITNVFHRAAERIERELDDNEQAQKRSQRDQDGSEIKSVELERHLREGTTMIERRDTMEFFREACADQFRVHTRHAWSPRNGSLVNRKALTATMIDSRDFIAARKRAENEVLMPQGTLIAITGGADYQDHRRIWDALDKTHAKYPDMVLLHGARRPASNISPSVGHGTAMSFRSGSSPTGHATTRPPHSNAMISCSLKCRWVSSLSRVLASMPISPTRPARWASPCGGSNDRHGFSGQRSGVDCTSEQVKGIGSGERTPAMSADLSETRDALLSALLRKGSAGAAPEGVYDAIRHQRAVLPGADQSSIAASMVSWHESFHAFLNASTTYGTAMMLSGALAPAGFPQLADLVRRMIGHALTVHETYATVAAVCAVSRGPVDTALLADYPDYQPFLVKFLGLFDPARPKLSAMALTSCARAAMQTAIYDQLLTLPCAEWADVTIGVNDRPDRRFKLILTPESAARAMAAVGAALARAGGPLAPLALAGATPEKEIACLLSASLADQEVVNIAAFESFAREFVPLGLVSPVYDGQKERLPEMLDKANRAGGSLLGSAFRMPSDVEDREALFHDFRNETLVFGELPVAARVVDGRAHPIEMAGRFSLKAGEERYLQLVAMPSAKARYLYRGPAGADPLLGWTGESVTFLRCGRRDDTQRWVDLMLLDGERAVAVSEAHPNHLLVFTASLNAIRDPDWRAQWPVQEGEATKLLVLIDDDPFDLVERFASRGSTIRFAGLTAGLGPTADAQKIELLCIAADDEPDLLYVSPTSKPYREAIVDVALRTLAGTTVDKAIITTWIPLLSKAIPHWVSEERQFGTRIWE